MRTTSPEQKAANCAPISLKVGLSATISSVMLWTAVASGGIGRFGLMSASNEVSFSRS